MRILGDQAGFMKRLMFVDDHPIYRDGVRRALEAGIAGLAVVVAAGPRKR